jgi:hypothetical protein
MPATQTKVKTKTRRACHREKKAHSSAADREAVRFFFTTPPVPFTKASYARNPNKG